MTYYSHTSVFSSIDKPNNSYPAFGYHIKKTFNTGSVGVQDVPGFTILDVSNPYPLHLKLLSRKRVHHLIKYETFLELFLF